jgi:protein ImuB
VQTGLAGPDHAAELTHLVDRLGARFGLRRVTRIVPQDTHIPEYAVATVAAATTATAVATATYRNVPAHTTQELRWVAPQRPPPRLGGRDWVGAYTIVGAGPPPPHPSPVNGGGSRLSLPRQQSAYSLTEQDSLAPVRPIRLFEQPERIDAIASVPDGPPVQFTWRRVRYAVAHVEGPERIALDWWRDGEGKPITRDYFRVESREGIRVWLYREDTLNRPALTRWFLHGVFA